MCYCYLATAFVRIDMVRVWGYPGLFVHIALAVHAPQQQDDGCAAADAQHQLVVVLFVAAEQQAGARGDQEAHGRQEQQRAAGGKGQERGRDVRRDGLLGRRFVDAA